MSISRKILLYHLKDDKTEICPHIQSLKMESQRVTLLLFMIFIGICTPTVFLVTGIVCLTDVCGSDLIFPYWFIASSVVIIFSTVCVLIFDMCMCMYILE